MTKEEILKFEDVVGYRIAIRVRLSNDGDTPIQYLASSLDGKPLGYSLHRHKGARDWKYIPNSRGKTGEPGTEFVGTGYEWRVVHPRSFVEREILSYTSKSEEFAFSALVRDEAKGAIREVTSDVIHPIY